MRRVIVSIADMLSDLDENVVFLEIFSIADKLLIALFHPVKGNPILYDAPYSKKRIADLMRVVTSEGTDINWFAGKREFEDFASMHNLMHDIEVKWEEFPGSEDLPD